MMHRPWIPATRFAWRFGCVRLTTLATRADATTFDSTKRPCSTTNTVLPKHDTQAALPSHANVVVIGGGIIGCSVAYHLAKLGVDVLLLEQSHITSGTTWHAAGLVNTYGSMSATSIAMRQYTRDLYANILPEETGLDTGFRDVGFIELACDADRLYNYRKVAAFNRLCGVNVHEITAKQVKELFPLCETGDILAGFHVPTDGRVNPVDATRALQRGATNNGVKVLEHTRVVSIQHAYSRDSLIPHVVGVRLQNGHDIQANQVVNCAGMWARSLLDETLQAHVTIPNQAAEHYYVLTDAMPNVDPSWPVIEDSSKCVYIRPEGQGLLVGLFEWDGRSWNGDDDRSLEVPADFSFGQLSPDWDRLEPYILDAYQRVPAAQDVGIQSLFCGPESFTPDNMPVVGEAPYLKNLFVAAGMNSLGITTGGGIGRVLAHWMKEGHPPLDVDVTGININRFHAYQSNLDYRLHRGGEALGHTYKVHYPELQYVTCRNVKESIFYERLIDKGAYMKDVSGWESPGWYNPTGTTKNEMHVPIQHSFGRESWFPLWEAEHFACRNDVALFDMSFMSKFLVQGLDAGAFLNRLSTANVVPEEDYGAARTPKITYTQWLNEQGTLEADLTVTQLSSPHKFLVVATDTMHHHVQSYMMKHLNRDWHATVTDVTGQYAQLNIQGPLSRELLQKLTHTSLETSDFPFRYAAEIDIGVARVWCIRVTYVGELGYELLIPIEHALQVYDRICRVAADEPDFGFRHAGLRALGSLRMEKAYRDYGHDIDGTDTALEAGLGFTCNFEKEGGFIGRDKVLEQKKSMKENGGLLRRMVQVLVKDPEPLMSHGEVLWRDGQRTCEIRAASFGHTLGGAVGLAMLEPSYLQPDIIVNKEYIKTGDWQVEIADKFYKCDLSFAPMYDPKSAKVKV